MFNLPHQPTERTPIDFTQMILLCAVALLLGLTIPLKGTFVVTFQIVTDVIRGDPGSVALLAIPLLALVIIASGVAAFRSRKRLFGVIIFATSLYTLIATNVYLQAHAFIPGMQQPGLFLLLSSNFLLVLLSIGYLIRPGVRPARIFWLRQEPRANRFIRLAAICFMGGLICQQNNLPILGYSCIAVSFVFVYLARRTPV